MSDNRSFDTSAEDPVQRAIRACLDFRAEAGGLLRDLVPAFAAIVHAWTQLPEGSTNEGVFLFGDGVDRLRVISLDGGKRLALCHLSIAEARAPEGMDGIIVVLTACRPIDTGDFAEDSLKRIEVFSLPTTPDAPFTSKDVDPSADASRTDAFLADPQRKLSPMTGEVGLHLDFEALRQSPLMDPDASERQALQDATDLYGRPALLFNLAWLATRIRTALEARAAKHR